MVDLPGWEVEIAQAQVIALSGHSGQSRGPHLHLDVAAGCCAFPPDYNEFLAAQTQPLTFRNAGQANSQVAADPYRGLRYSVS